MHSCIPENNSEPKLLFVKIAQSEKSLTAFFFFFPHFSIVENWFVLQTIYFPLKYDVIFWKT